MTGPRFIALIFSIVTAYGCSSESTSQSRDSAPAPSDAGTDGDAATTPPNPNGGRDDKAASCYAACQNGKFACAAKESGQTTTSSADLTPEADGCGGTLTKGAVVVALKLDCNARKVCLGDAPGQPATSCVGGLYSAFTFAYAPSAGAPQNVCTRE